MRVRARVRARVIRVKVRVLFSPINSHDVVPLAVMAVVLVRRDHGGGPDNDRSWAFGKKWGAVFPVFHYLALSLARAHTHLFVLLRWRGGGPDVLISQQLDMDREGGKIKTHHPSLAIGSKP